MSLNASILGGKSVGERTEHHIFHGLFCLESQEMKPEFIPEAAAGLSGCFGKATSPPGISWDADAPCWQTGKDLLVKV